jgi:hypothetical protein
MIKIHLDQSEIDKCKKFAEEVTKETYNRFNQSDTIRAKRIFIGKVGEIAFLKLLKENGISPDVSDMFKIFPGIKNVDGTDFLTNNNKKIDIKTAYESFHSRLLVPYDQFEDGRAKDYYVGVKIFLEEKIAEIWGFCTKEVLNEQGKKDFGEGLAYWESLNKLRDIKELLLLMDSHQQTLDL